MPPLQPQPAARQPAHSVRDELVRLMRATIVDRANWTYKAIRPLPVPETWKPGQKVVADCSHGVKLLCRWAGAPDPMGNGWAPWGNSTTIALNLFHLNSPTDLAAGDIITFGPGGTQHAAMVLEPGANPLLWSFGHQGAPNVYRLFEDRREKQYLRLPLPLPPATLEGFLRARTGYWSWLAWREGEGDWKPHGKKNPRVRPNVPTVIPARWWALRARFLLNRKKGNAASDPMPSTVRPIR